MCEKETDVIIKYLVEHGADINESKNENGEIPLFSICKNGIFKRTTYCIIV